jgi:hypothetical protein
VISKFYTFFFKKKNVFIIVSQELFARFNLQKSSNKRNVDKLKYLYISVKLRLEDEVIILFVVTVWAHLSCTDIILPQPKRKSYILI